MRGRAAVALTEIAAAKRQTDRGAVSWRRPLLARLQPERWRSRQRGLSVG